MEIETVKFNTKKSLTWTLAVAFLSLSLTMLLLSSILQVYVNFRTQQQIISEEQNLIAQNAADTVKNFIQEKYNILETTANVSSLTTTEQLGQTDILSGALGHELSFRQLVFLDPQNQEKASVSRLSKSASGKLTDKLDGAAITTLEQGKETISQVYIDPVTNEPMVVITAPVKNVFGDFQGTLLAEVNLKFMWDLVGTLKIGKKGQAFVVDNKGTLLAYADISRVLREENLKKLPEVAEFITENPETHGNNASVLTGINGNMVVTTHVRLGVPDWAIIIELPIFEAYAPVINQLEFAGLIVILAVILTMAMGLFLSKRITRPIITLRDTAEKIRKGSFDARIDIRSDDEIGQLADSFNQMATQLQESYGLLEQKVTERTAQLEEAKKQLEENVSELERMNKLMVGRELKMTEMKKEIEVLYSKLAGASTPSRPEEAPAAETPTSPEQSVPPPVTSPPSVNHVPEDPVSISPPSPETELTTASPPPTTDSPTTTSPPPSPSSPAREDLASPDASTATQTNDDGKIEA